MGTAWLRERLLCAGVPSHSGNGADRGGGVGLGPGSKGNAVLGRGPGSLCFRAQGAVEGFRLPCLGGGNPIFTENGVATFLPGKPQFAREDWKEAATLAEMVHGRFSEGELDQTLSEQEMPEPEIPLAGPDTPTGQESRSWEAEFSAGYGRVRWSVSAGTVEHNFPSSAIRN